MSVVDLEILHPRHRDRLVGEEPVRLQGRIVLQGSDGDGPLYVKWYSSLQAGATDEAVVERPEDAPLNGPGQTLDFERLLRLGTHVLTFSAKDAPGDEQADLENVTRAGVAGGRDPEQNPCVVTVLDAEILELERKADQPLPVLSGEITLTARAPARWGMDVSNPDDDPAYERDPDYHEHNTVGYRWELVPDGAEHPAVSWQPDPDELEFDPDEPGETGKQGPPRVRLRRQLPGGLSGRHALVLRVFDVGDPDGPHSKDTMEVEVS